MSGADCSEPPPGGQGSLARVVKAAKMIVPILAPTRRSDRFPAPNESRPP